ncbi:PAS domain S-box protein [Cytophagaceae bacterium ABcell3]|nr:PAS domain S-box protein [Cytophagaceae bacterium ABcell3]
MSFKENESNSNFHKQGSNFSNNQFVSTDTEEKKSQHKNDLYSLICQENFTSSDIDTILRQVVINLKLYFDISFAGFFCNMRDDKFKIIAEQGSFSSFSGEDLVPKPAFGQANYTFQTGTSVFTKDFHDNEAFVYPEKLDTLKVKSVLTVQVPGKPEPYGVLCICWTNPVEENPEVTSFAESICNLLSAAIIKKKSEEALKQSENHYKELFNKSSEMIYIIDEKGYFTDINETALNLHGFSKEEIIGNTVNFLTDTDKQQENALSGYLEKAWKNDGKPFEWWGRKKSGESFLQELYIRKGWYFNSEAYIVHGRDITEKRLAEENIKAGEKRYLTLLQTLNDGVLYTDTSDKIVFCNKRFSEMSNYDLEELINTHVSALLPEQDIQVNGRRAAFETVLKTKGADEKNVLASAVPITNNDEKVNGSLYTFTDITEKKYTEKELEGKKNEINQFLYKVSHDMKGPLMSMMGLVNLAKEEVEDPVASSYFSMMSTLADKLDTILTDLKDLTTVRTTKSNPVEIQVPEFFIDLAEHIKDKENAENVKITVNVDDTLKVVQDINVLQIVFGNIIENAIVFRNRNLPKPEVVIEAKIENDLLKVRVKDNGSGIEEEKLPKIFDLFYRGNMHSKGSGMGLYLVENAIQKLQGKLKVDSAFGAGTEVTVSIPAETV